MADWENRLGQESPLSRALRVAMPDDLRNPLLHPEAVNHFAMPPQQPRAELRNLPPRPGDYLSPVSEALSPTMGAYGLGNALGDAYVKGREGDYKGMASPLAEILLGMAPVPGMKKGAMPPRVENPIKAYHGSPHDFDRFDLSKIGTGEGAQAYGHGLYFAENEGVARSYREGLSKWKPHIDGVPVMDLWAEGKLPQKMGEVAGLNRVDSISASNWVTEAVRTGKPLQDVLAEKIETARRIYPPELAEPEIASIKAVGEKIMPFAPEVAKGHTYEVAIHASPDQFLDWDKPLSQQSEAVRKAMPTVQEKAVEARRSAKPDTFSADDAAYLRSPDLRVEDLVRMFGQNPAPLNEAGIPGIRYLDQGSRGAGQGTSNYVVFDPAILEILRKYGLLGPVAAGATANALMGDKDQQ